MSVVLAKGIVQNLKVFDKQEKKLNDKDFDLIEENKLTSARYFGFDFKENDDDQYDDYIKLLKDHPNIKFKHLDKKIYDYALYDDKVERNLRFDCPYFPSDLFYMELKKYGYNTDIDIITTWEDCFNISLENEYPLLKQFNLLKQYFYKSKIGECILYYISG